MTALLQELPLKDTDPFWLWVGAGVWLVGMVVLFLFLRKRRRE